MKEARGVIPEKEAVDSLSFFEKEKFSKKGNFALEGLTDPTGIGYNL